MTKVFEYHNNILCVTAEVLYEGLNLITYEAYLHRCKKGTLKRERTGRPGFKALVNFELLPDGWKSIITEKYGDPYKTVKNEAFTDHITIDAAAIVYYRDYRYDENKALSDDKQQEYCMNANLLNTVQTLISNRKARCKALGGRAKNVWENIADVLANLDKVKYKHSLPSNPRSLQRVLARYKAQGYQGLVHKGFGNDNSEKINPNAKLWVLSRWTNQVQKCANIQQLFLEYNAQALVNGWKQLKDQTSLYLYLYSEDVQGIWWGHRHGELKAKEKFSFQHSTKLPSMRDSLWYSDGTKLNYFYQDAQGKVRTINVYEIMDSYSEVLLGYCISESEDYQTQYSAYKMAVQVAGHKPYQLGFDNQGGHGKLVAGSFLSKIARLAIKTQPYNGKSKTIESAFGRFQSQFLKRDWFFTGQNVQAKRDESKANMEFINANKANLPTLAEIKATYKQRRDEWNNAPHPTTGKNRMEMYMTSMNEATPVIEMWDMIDMFWILRPEPVMYNAYGLTITEKKEKFTYSVFDENGMPDMAWHTSNIDKRFWIKYDPEDMGTILLYDKDASGNLRFVTRAMTKVEVVRNKQEQTSKDTQWIAAIKKLNDTTRVERMNAMEDILMQHGMSAEQQGLNTPKILGINSKRKKAKKVPADHGATLKEESELVPVIAPGRMDDEDFDIYKNI